MKTHKRFLIILTLLILVAGGGVIYWLSTRDQDSVKQPHTATNSALSGPKVTLKATDGTSITARPYLVKGATTGVVITHDLNKNRSETLQFAEELAIACKCSTIAIDLRGHGQSGGSRQDAVDMYQDVKAGGEYLKAQGVQEVTYAGFGFGAYPVLQAGVDTKAPALILVSPSKDDKGIKAVGLVAQYNGRLLVAASKTDSSSNRMASKLFNLSQVSNRQFAEYESGGHGIRMVYDTDLGKVIKDWLASASAN